jgi:hypothetical protein
VETKVRLRDEAPPEWGKCPACGRNATLDRHVSRRPEGSFLVTYYNCNNATRRLRNLRKRGADSDKHPIQKTEEPIDMPPLTEELKAQILQSSKNTGQSLGKMSKAMGRSEAFLHKAIAEGASEKSIEQIQTYIDKVNPAQDATSEPPVCSKSEPTETEPAEPAPEPPVCSESEHAEPVCVAETSPESRPRQRLPWHLGSPTNLDDIAQPDLIRGTVRISGSEILSVRSTEGELNVEAYLAVQLLTRLPVEAHYAIVDLAAARKQEQQAQEHLDQLLKIHGGER